LIGRLVRSVDFEQVLRSPPRARSAHFAVHHANRVPSLPARKLSTAQSNQEDSPVDESPARASGVWLGTVVPKRHARRSVTRNLLKRQMRAAVAGQQAGLLPGLWVIRLRAPFERTEFRSAASSALRRAVAGELSQLMRQAAQRAAHG
jgi:ribonuclease P protein component